MLHAATFDGVMAFIRPVFALQEAVSDAVVKSAVDDFNTSAQALMEPRRSATLSSAALQVASKFSRSATLSLAALQVASKFSIALVKAAVAEVDAAGQALEQ
jgi:hypothetical protein